MNATAIRAVARREVRDSFTDWRMMLPVMILTFIVPLLIQIALVFLLNFLKDVSTVTRLVPFGVLLCGFLPASFSLISALESFVGEKERNTLKSLLATPMNDSDLYLGKLIAALMMPLFSAMLAMVTFMLLLLTRSSTGILAQLTTITVIEMFGLVACKAVVMVAGAVIISSHTTTTRAANLLASLILIPMATVVQLEALIIVGRPTFVDRLFGWIFLALVMVAALLIRAGLSAFNREAILSREHAGFSFPRVRWALNRFFSAYHPAGVAPERYEGRFSARRFYRTELWALLRDYRPALLVATIGTLLSAAVGWQLFGFLHLKALDEGLAQLATPPVGGLGLGLQIFSRNIRASFFSNFFAPVSFGLFSFLVPTVAAASIGYSAASTSGTGQVIPFLVGYVLPHGLIELPAAILSAALGLRIGGALLLAPKGFTIGQNILWALANFLKVWIFVLIPLFLVAGLIEGLISPLVIAALFG